MPDVGEVFRTDVIGDFDGTELLVNSYQFLKVDVGTITDAELLDDFGNDHDSSVHNLKSALHSTHDLAQDPRARCDKRSYYR